MVANRRIGAVVTVESGETLGEEGTDLVVNAVLSTVA